MGVEKREGSLGAGPTSCQGPLLGTTTVEGTGSEKEDERKAHSKGREGAAGVSVCLALGRVYVGGPQDPRLTMVFWSAFCTV